jgi:hypothetical protein
MTAYRSLLHPIAANDAPITANNIRLHLFAADYSALQRECNPL